MNNIDTQTNSNTTWLRCSRSQSDTARSFRETHDSSLLVWVQSHVHENISDAHRSSSAYQSNLYRQTQNYLFETTQIQDCEKKILSPLRQCGFVTDPVKQRTVMRWVHCLLVGLLKRPHKYSQWLEAETTDCTRRADKKPGSPGLKAAGVTSSTGPNIGKSCTDYWCRIYGRVQFSAGDLVKGYVGSDDLTFRRHASYI